MCSSNVQPEARKMLADLLRDMTTALDPDHPDAVQIGPVDFGPQRAASGRGST